MATFSTIATGTPYLSLAIVQELVLAYSERRQCIAHDPVTPIVAGRNLQDVAFWRGMQDWIDTFCSRWVNDGSFSTATEYDKVADITHTLATFRAEAGLNTNGFRRATSYPGPFSYGRIVAGDIIGPWIVQDLQKAFDAMRWTHLTDATLSNGRQKWISAGGFDYEWSTEVWDSTEWQTSSLWTPYWVEANVWGAWYQREYADSTFTTPDHLSHTANGYYWIRPFFSGGPAVDIDGLGMSHHKFYLRQSFVSATTTTRTIPQLPNILTIPPYYPPDGPDIMADPVLILKWGFTNTL